MKQKILLSWSGGKDSSLALYEMKKDDDLEITLLTTLTGDYGRISMHGVREILLDRQAKSIRCNLEKVYITAGATNESYELAMRNVLTKHINEGVTSVATGDIFLEDLRKYREDNLKKLNMIGMFPLWNRCTSEIAHTFINLGFKSIITCVDTNVLDKSFAGRIYDKGFLEDLPDNVDPCGENGEFHSFVFDGPIFNEKIEFAIGEKVLRDKRYYFCDLIV